MDSPDKIKNRFSKAVLLTLGCSKNDVDTEVLAGELKRNGIELVEDSDQADVIVINTCGFITDAKQESINTILEAVEIKRDDPSKSIVVWGCLAQRYEDELRKEIPEVDAFFGVERYEDLGKYISGESYKWNSAAYENRYRIDSGHTAYLKIADGCDHLCTFCAIPGIKGSYRSRTPESLLKEAVSLVDSGVKELIIIAQDTSLYGQDLAERSTLSTLLRLLVRIEKLEWIRIMYLHPAHVTDELIDLIAVEKKICKYIDIPLQHISDPILKRMGRRTGKEEIIRLLKKLRSRVPDIVIRTAFIVGFPGETDEMFDELIEFVKLFEFERLGAFIYSPEEGTAAVRLADRIDESVAIDRYNLLMSEQRIISERKNSMMVNQTVRILVDGWDIDREMIYGRTAGDAPDVDQLVWVEGRAVTGSFADVVILEYSEYDLIGKLS